jgi:D-alanyl-D-alanine carboxypeptidase
MPVISDHVWTAEEIVEFALANGVTERADSGWRYSNTGYVILGMLIEKVTGKTFSAYLRDTIFAPSNMKDTWAGGSENFPHDRLARAYVHADEVGKPIWNLAGLGDAANGVWDATEWFHLSGANAAGELVSTPSDIVSFLRSMIGGAILPDRMFSEMTNDPWTANFPGTPAVGYGLGVFIFERMGRRVMGHIGHIPGHTSLATWDWQSGAAMMVSQNSGGLDRHSSYMANINDLVFDLWEEVLPG